MPNACVAGRNNQYPHQDPNPPLTTKLVERSNHWDKGRSNLAAKRKTFPSFVYFLSLFQGQFYVSTRCTTSVQRFKSLHQYSPVRPVEPFPVSFHQIPFDKFFSLLGTETSVSGLPQNAFLALCEPLALAVQSLPSGHAGESDKQTCIKKFIVKWAVTQHVQRHKTDSEIRDKAGLRGLNTLMIKTEKLIRLTFRWKRGVLRIQSV